MTEKLYPGLGSQNDFHLFEVKRIRKEVQNDIQAFTKKREHKKEGHRISTCVNMASSVVSIGTGSSSIASLTTGVGAPLALPLGCTAIVAGLFTALSSYAQNNFLKGREKYSKLLEIANASFKRINMTVSEAVKDGMINQDEYKNILIEYDSFKEAIKEVRIRHRNKKASKKQENLIIAVREVLNEKQNK